MPSAKEKKKKLGYPTRVKKKKLGGSNPPPRQCTGRAQRFNLKKKNEKTGDINSDRKSKRLREDKPKRPDEKRKETTKFVVSQANT